VSEIVEQNGKLRGLVLFLGNVDVLLTQNIKRLTHQERRTKRMLKTGMHGCRVHKVREAKLLDVTQPLKIGMTDDIVEQISGNGDKTVYRIVNSLFFVQLLS
jgi:hypothetical protein